MKKFTAQTVFKTEAKAKDFCKAAGFTEFEVNRDNAKVQCTCGVSSITLYADRDTAAIPVILPRYQEEKLYIAICSICGNDNTKKYKGVMY